MIDILTLGLQTEYEPITYGFKYVEETPLTKHARLL